MAQRRVPQETEIENGVNRSTRYQYYNTLSCLGEVPNSPEEVGTVSGGNIFNGAFNLYQDGSGTTSFSASESEWVGMVAFQTVSDGPEYARVNGYDVQNLPTFSAGSTKIERIDVMEYGATVSFEMTGSGFFYAALARPKTIVDSNREVKWPYGLEGRKAERDW